MIQLFETSSVDSNCMIGPNDAPFAIPLVDNDHIFLRLQIPYYIIVANGGGLPIGANVTVKLTDKTGAVNLCSYGDATTGGFLYNFINDAVLRKAEYRFMIPLKIFGSDHITKTISVSTGDEIVSNVDGVQYTWLYGDEPTPYPFIDYAAGKICVRIPVAAVIAINVNGGAVIPTNLFTGDTVACMYEKCFRVQVSVTFGIVTRDYSTKMFQILPCDEESVFVESEYPEGTVDCAGQYDYGSTTSLYANRNYLRLPAGLERAPSNLKKTYNSKCFQFKSEIVKQQRLKSDPVPDWYQDAIETLVLGRNFKVDGNPFLIEAENIFENNDVPGTTFQNINVVLQSCKCEKVFVC